jgi:hypothetical protein
MKLLLKTLVLGIAFLGTSLSAEEVIYMPPPSGLQAWQLPSESLIVLNGSEDISVPPRTSRMEIKATEYLSDHPFTWPLSEVACSVDYDSSESLRVLNKNERFLVRPLSDEHCSSFGIQQEFG